MSLQRKDNFFLFTLIDFLLQIIFVALVCFGIYFLNQRPDDSIPAATMEKWKQVGIAKIVEFIDVATRLVPLDQLNELTTLLKQFKSLAELKIALEIFKKLDVQSQKIILDLPSEKLKIGLENLRGKPDCFKNAAGNGITIFRIAIDEASYTINFNNNDASTQIAEILEKTKYSFVSGKVFSPTELQEFGKRVSSSYKDCFITVALDINVNKYSSYAALVGYFRPREYRLNYKN